MSILPANYPTTGKTTRLRQPTIMTSSARGPRSLDSMSNSTDEPVELVLTLAFRDLFLSRLDINDGESPVGEEIWYRKHGD